ncbi:MAG: hypothetical protein WA941_13735 [Nitrososphaeraceae archaeon]
MNQQIRQKQILEQRMLGKANFEVANKRIRRSQKHLHGSQLFDFQEMVCCKME